MKNFWIALTVCAAFAGLSGSAAAASSGAEEQFLDFRPQSRPPHSNTANLVRSLGGAVRSRISASLNFGSLSAIAVGAGAARRSDPRLSGQTLLVKLDARQPRRLNVQTVYEVSPGVFSYAGKIEGNSSSHFTISVKGREVLGKIHEDQFLFVVQGDDGLYDLTEIDKTLLVQDEEHDTIATESVKDSPSLSKTSTNGNVRLLYLYTPAVVSRNGSPDVLVSNIISETNSSMHSSGLSSDNFISLAGMVPLSTDFPGQGRETILNNMFLRRDAFSTLNANMQYVGADIPLAMISADDSAACPDADPSDGVNTCRVDRVGGVTTGSFTPAVAIVQTDSYALGDFSAPHEIGHALGGQHQVGSGTIRPGAQPDARGVIDSSGTWQTVMGGYNQTNCVFRTLNSQPSCIRLPIWSNPFNGTGVAGVSDMVRALGVQMPAAAAWFDDNVTASGTTGDISVSRYSTVATVSWAPANGWVQSYQLEVAVGSSTKPYFSLVYSGPNTSASRVVKLGQTLQWRVRACNSSGCGPYTTRIGIP